MKCFLNAPVSSILLKKTYSMGGGIGYSVVEHMPSINVALGSTLSTQKKIPFSYIIYTCTNRHTHCTWNCPYFWLLNTVGVVGTQKNKFKMYGEDSALKAVRQFWKSSTIVVEWRTPRTLIKGLLHCEVLNLFWLILPLLSLPEPMEPPLGR